MIKTVKNLIGIASKYPINMGKINSLQNFIHEDSLSFDLFKL